ncbi:MAG: hypothetical protein JW901_05485 [Dehalococcoidia bacterium]|nr:hypothetical protein [Dehalococcoidia bacterium]
MATLAIKSPYSESIAEWSAAQKQAGNHSAKLYKDGTGSDGSTHVQFTPPTGITLANWTAGIAAGKYSFYHYCSAVSGNFAQFEFRFEDPNSDAWVEITAVPLQSYLGTAAWVLKTLVDGDNCGYGGVGEAGASFFNWGPLTALSAVEAAVNAEGVVDSASDWILSRVRLELWEATPERTCYIDTVKVNDVTYTMEPGGTAPALSLDSGYVEVGYTADGVTFEYNATTSPIKVEEETFPLDLPITEESIAIKCNMAESSLFNIDKAMAGASLSGNVITLGGGVQKKVALKLVGTSPDGFSRTIYVPLAAATGGVSTAFKKGEKNVLPVEFQALKGDSDVCTIIDNAV